MEAPGAERQGPRWRRWMPGAAVFVWPFVYFMPYVWPRDGSYRSVENDFLSLYYNYKVYLLDCLSQARFPWWSPSEAAGFPFYSNPFTQAFYPLNVPLALLYRLRGGYTTLDHQRFTVLGVALFALGLYAWLRALGRSPRAALVAALILSVSFRMAETLRFPNAVHTAAWYPWILYAATRTLQEPSLRGKATFGLLCGLAGAFWLTGGYIYYLYYGLFLFGPYLVLLCVPKLGLAPAGHVPVRPVAALLVLGAFGLGAAALCGPYLLQSRALLQQTVDRQGGSWEYATASVFTSLDTLGSLVYPPAAQSEGWVYFGLAPLLLVVVYLLSAPAGLGPRLVLPAWLAAIAWITHGRDSPLFALLWHLPFFSHLRVWARLSMIMLPILAWLLALAYQHFEELAAGHLGPGSRRRALACLLGGYAVLGGAQWALHLRGVRDPYWGAFFGDLRLLEPLFAWSGAASFLVVALLLLGPSWRRATARGVAGGTVAGLLVLMAWLETGPAGTRLWSGVRPDAHPSAAGHRPEKRRLVPHPAGRARHHGDAGRDLLRGVPVELALRALRALQRGQPVEARPPRPAAGPGRAAQALLLRAGGPSFRARVPGRQRPLRRRAAQGALVRRRRAGAGSRRARARVPELHRQLGPRLVGRGRR